MVGGIGVDKGVGEKSLKHHRPRHLVPLPLAREDLDDGERELDGRSGSAAVNRPHQFCFLAQEREGLTSSQGCLR